jgi:hypothetical protein
MGGTHRGYRRIFNCGDQEGFDWNKGGRLYSQGEDSYQRLHKDERLKMLIDGQPVVEIDVTASFLTILHARCARPLDLSRDPYARRRAVQIWRQYWASRPCVSRWNRSAGQAGNDGLLLGSLLLGQIFRRLRPCVTAQIGDRWRGQGRPPVLSTHIANFAVKLAQRPALSHYAAN